jgi:O-antigen/teichoic acid export membrane protein
VTGGPFSGRRLAVDAGWNYAALAVTGVVGAVVSFVIAGRLGADALGVFTQLYAVHVIGAQVAVFGVHDSTQRHVAEAAGSGRDDGPIVSAGLGVVLVTASLLAALVAGLAPAIGRLLASADVERGLYLVAPGIVCFAANKVLFAALNGRGLLRRYAWAQILRAVFVLAAVVAIAAAGLPGYTAGGVFAVAEGLLLPCLLAVVRPSPVWAAPARAGREWWPRHLGFGGRGLVNAMLLETHLRVDVMMLGYFVADRAVGVYAFAALFAEGLYQVPVVIRTVAYPMLVRLAGRGDRIGLARATRRLAAASGGLCAAAATVIALVYPWAAGRFDAEFVSAGGPVLLVLLAGMTVYAFFVPFDQLLLQSGLPGRQSLLMAVYVGCNVVLNAVLIPGHGLLGAAVATAVSLMLAGLLLLGASWVWLGYRGGVLLHRAPLAQ